MIEGLGLGEVYRGTIERIKAQGVEYHRRSLRAQLFFFLYTFSIFLKLLAIRSFVSH